MAPRRPSVTGPAAHSFGRVLRQRRHELRLTLEALAELVPSSVQHLSEIERGVRYASLPLLVRIDWALSGVDALAGWTSTLVVEQLGLHQPVYAASRGGEGLEPARNTRGEERDPAAIAARVDELLAHLRRHAAMAVDQLSPAAEAQDAPLSPPGVGTDHGDDEPDGAALVGDAVPGPGDRVGASPPLRLWLDCRPCIVRVLAAEVETDDAAPAGAGRGGGVKRRTFIKVGGLGTLGTAVAPAGGLVRLSSMDPRVLDHLERETERLPADLWSGPESPNYPRVEDTYELANALLTEVPRLRDQVRLHRVTARLAVLRAQGELFRDRRDVAERWYRLAAERAVEVGDTGLALWALAHLALNQAWTGAASRGFSTSSPRPATSAAGSQAPPRPCSPPRRRERTHGSATGRRSWRRCASPRPSSTGCAR